MYEQQYLERAQALIDVQRYEQALEELQKALGENPESGPAHLMSLVCYTQMGQQGRAIALAKELLATQAENPMLYYLLAFNLANDNALPEAIEVAERGIGIAPDYANLVAFMGELMGRKKDWEAALEYANRALAIDPSHVGGLNVRLEALNKLGRKEEMQTTMQETLAADPNSSYAHTNIGWAQLESKQPDKAKEHFLEALRLEPNNQRARVGLLEALKAKNFLYRLLLNWMFFIGKQTEQAQWFIIIAIFFGYQYLHQAAQAYPILMPLVILVALSVYATWLMQPLFNLFIKMDKTARHILTKEESIMANVVGIGLVTAAGFFLAYWQLQGELFFVLGIFSLTILIPTSNYFRLIRTDKQQYALWSLIGLWTIGLSAIGAFLLGNAMGPTFWSTYIFLLIGYSFLANYWAGTARSTK